VFTVKSKAKPSVTSSELWKAKQLKEYRRINNLCFKCGEKYSPAHTCARPAANLNAIGALAGDGGGLLFDDMLFALESPQFHMMQDECFLSLHAMSGQPQHKAIQLRALVKNQALIILVDSRSSHTFLNLAMVARLQAPITPITALSVKVANGALLSCSWEVQIFQW
jgi:uncharacterized membrane protein YhfC